MTTVVVHNVREVHGRFGELRHEDGPHVVVDVVAGKKNLVATRLIRHEIEHFQDSVGDGVGVMADFVAQQVTVTGAANSVRVVVDTFLCVTDVLIDSAKNVCVENNRHDNSLCGWRGLGR